MGGISVLVLAGFGLAMLAVFGIAAAMFVAGIVIAVVFAFRTKTRRAQGKRLGWRILIPTLLIAVSAPVLIWFSLALFVPAFEDWANVDYSDYSQMRATMPQSMPPTGQAAQNHMADVPSGLKFEGSGDVSTGANISASPTMVAMIMMVPQTAPSFFLCLLLRSRESRISSLISAAMISSISRSSEAFLLYSATLIRPSSIP